MPWLHFVCLISSDPLDIISHDWVNSGWYINGCFTGGVFVCFGSLSGLGMENIGGIFVVLICGLIIAVFVAIMEFLWSTRRSAETDEVCPHTCPRRTHRHTPVGSRGLPPKHLMLLFCVRVYVCVGGW